MPDEKEQDALSRIKSYLDEGHSLDAIRQIGWGSWIDRLEAKGYDVRTGRLMLRPPDKEPESQPTHSLKEGAEVATSASTEKTTDVEASPFDIVARPIRAWWAFSMQHRGFGKVLALSAPFLSVLVLVFIILVAISDGDQAGSGDRASSSSGQRSEARASGDDVTTVTGRGQQVSRFLKFEEGLVRFEVTHDGTSPTIIWLLRDDGSKLELLVNEWGPFDGSTAVRIPAAGRYLLDIEAAGNWKVIARQ